MFLQYTKTNGHLEELELVEPSFTIGRSQDADLVLDDEKASRMHCVVRREGDTFFLKDLQSKNGTFVNGDPVADMQLSHGDRIKVGSTILNCVEERATGTNTAIHEVEEKMAQGKGYGTILKEIVGDVEDNKPRPPSG